MGGLTGNRKNNFFPLFFFLCFGGVGSHSFLRSFCCGHKFYDTNAITAFDVADSIKIGVDFFRGWFMGYLEGG